MKRWIILVTVLLLAANSIGSASTMCEEAWAKQHKASQAHDDSSKAPALCDLCCHCHLLALGSMQAERLIGKTGHIKPDAYPQFLNWQQAPPTPPPNC